MELIEKKDFYKFCKDFAHEFISSECMMKEFRNLSCGDAQLVNVHLENHLLADLRDWLEEHGVEIDD